MNKMILGLAILAICGLARAHDVVPGEYLVKVKPQFASVENLQMFAEANHGEQVFEEWVLVRRSPVQLQASVVSELQNNPAIEAVEPNYIMYADKMPNDPETAKLWGMKNVGGRDRDNKAGVAGIDVNAEKAWDITTGSRKVVVAIIDTGVDYSHVDLKNNIWTNQAEANGKAGVDDDNNGFIDDIHGYDFANTDADPMDDNKHGTHCAGTIGGEGDNGVGVAGVNWQVSIMAVKFLTGAGSGTLANAVKAIKYAADNGANVMSNSWGGGGFTQSMKDVIEYAKTKGILFIAAAGNDGSNNDTTPKYPASYDVDNVVSVAAIDISGSLASFSNYGAKAVHVAAPGVNVYSSVPGGYDYLSGTSMATPHVSGVAALVWAAHPELKYNEVRSRLIYNSKPLANLKGRIASGGLVDAYAAMTGTTPPPDENDPSNFPNAQPVSIETEHPYTDNLTKVYEVSVPGATKLAVFFDQFSTEEGYDFVSFKNAAGTVVGSWSGARGAGFSPVVDGDKMTIEFKTDTDTVDQGFKISKAVFKK